MLRACTKCGEGFDARGDWQRLCWTCYRRRDRHDTYGATYAEGLREGYQTGYREGRAESLQQIAPGFLTDLIQLAHPDRHPPERAQLANQATALLIQMREHSRS